MKNTKSITVFQTLAKMFKQIQFPKFILTDNAPCLRSAYLKQKLGEYGTLLMCSAPYLSNGNIAESFIRVFKMHADKLSTDWYEPESLLKILFKMNCLQNKTGLSPYSVTFHRFPETERLSGLKRPSLDEKVQKPTWTHTELRNRLSKPQNLNDSFQIGSRVFFREKGMKSKKWEQAIITKIEKPLFVLKDDDGKTFTRHEKHCMLKPHYSDTD